jgi:hypothetical protein
VIRKDATLFADRWWSAPARLGSRAAAIALLRKSIFPRPAPSDPWVRQTPNGIRA